MRICKTGGRAGRNRELKRKARRKVLSSLSKSELRKYRTVKTVDKIFFVAVACLLLQR